MNILIFIIATLTFLSISACGQIKTSITVYDESGKPIENAFVRILYEAYQYENNVTKSATTNEKGEATISGFVEASMRVSIEKDGYYKTSLNDLDHTRGYDLKLILRKKINPISLYAKKVRIGLPKKNTWIGYDFEIGDLVVPYGKGRERDILIKIQSLPVNSSGQPVLNNDEGRLQIKFPNNHEGFVFERKDYLKESEMKMPHKAPIKNYSKNYSRIEHSYHNENSERDAGIFLRIRVKERNGAIEQANYVKIDSDIQFDPRETGWHVADKGLPKLFGGIAFTYYFNPTPNDRNLEFDPQRNLFKNLERNERVADP